MTAPITIQHSRPHQCQGGVEDEFGSKFMWYELTREVRQRWPDATSNLTQAELIGELRDPTTLKIALGLEPWSPSPAIANGTLYVPESYGHPRSITRFFPEEQRE